MVQLTGTSYISCNCLFQFYLRSAQIDDEKFLFKHELKPEQTLAFSKQNARDIIACGFKPEKTFIFSDFEYMGYVEA